MAARSRPLFAPLDVAARERSPNVDSSLYHEIVVVGCTNKVILIIIIIHSQRNRRGSCGHCSHEDPGFAEPSGQTLTSCHPHKTLLAGAEPAREHVRARDSQSPVLAIVHVSFFGALCQFCSAVLNQFVVVVRGGVSKHTFFVNLIRSKFVSDGATFV